MASQSCYLQHSKKSKDCLAWCPYFCLCIQYPSYFSDWYTGQYLQGIHQAWIIFIHSLLAVICCELHCSFLFTVCYEFSHNSAGEKESPTIWRNVWQQSSSAEVQISEKFGKPTDQNACVGHLFVLDSSCSNLCEVYLHHLCCSRYPRETSRGHINVPYQC